MGKKYRASKEALRTNPARSLLVIDDWSLRLKLFSEAESIIKKIDKVERDRDNFSSQDQRLFNDWYELTFRQEKKETEDRHREYMALAKLHNDIIAVTEMQNISPHRAYLLLKEEESHYQSGSESQRAKIDKLRQERAEFAQKAMDAEFGSSFEEEAEEEEEEDFDDLEDPEGFETLIKDQPDLSALSRAETKLYRHFKTVTPEELRNDFLDSDDHLLAMNAIRIASLAEDQFLVLKIWDALSSKTRQRIAKDFKKGNGGLIEEFMEGLRAALNQKHFKNKDSKDSDSNQDAKDSFPLPEDKERDLKFIFRKLVRMIHPDSQDPKLSAGLKTWYNKVWQRVQDAYKNKDLHQLRRLEIMAMIRRKELDSLTFAEIQASTEWLEEELTELRASLKGYEKHPAWKFSTKRNYDTLIKKIKKEFQTNLQPILLNIEQLKEIHNFYEKASYPNLRASSRKRKSHRGASRRPKRKNSSQMSLFD